MLAAADRIKAEGVPPLQDGHRRMVPQRKGRPNSLADHAATVLLYYSTASATAAAAAAAAGAAPSAGASTYATSLSTLSGPGSSSTTSLSGPDFLRDLFHKRLISLVHLKRSLHSRQAWFQTVHMNQDDLAAAFDNDRMKKRTVRYLLLGLSLSGILEITNPSDMARAIVSLTNELDNLTDDTVVALTAGAGTTSQSTQRNKMRSFFKSGNKTLKRAAATQAISEFGFGDSTAGPSSSFAHPDQASYLMTPNIPMQLDFFQVFFTLCDMLTEVYHKMLSFLPKDATNIAAAADMYEAYSSGLSRTSSPPPSSTAGTGSERDRTGSISQAFSTVSSVSGHYDSVSSSAHDVPISDKSHPVISPMTQELLLKADAKIKKAINQQVKEIDILARQVIKQELASLDPSMQELGLGPTQTDRSTGNGAAGIASNNGHTSGLGTGLPSGSSLPFSIYTPAMSSSGAPGPAASHRVPDRQGAIPPHVQRAAQQVPRSSTDMTQATSSAFVPGHHQFNLASIGSGGSATAKAADTESSQAGTVLGSLIRSRSGKLRNVISGPRPSSSASTTRDTTSAPHESSSPSADESIVSMQSSRESQS
ncbi:hypothetical protein BCV70DRAFT_211992 [Testicularia cyperi]|uniref:Uncharacterized protein n=1 Tax=Testicularia cyperi TaxID=1882483 RepID=A0A317XPF9_9BASI|nr:hypothetical protein BCV70DRAFT_211992 [Testicularia cyperi]